MKKRFVFMSLFVIMALIFPNVAKADEINQTMFEEAISLYGTTSNGITCEENTGVYVCSLESGNYELNGTLNLGNNLLFVDDGKEVTLNLNNGA